MDFPSRARCQSFLNQLERDTTSQTRLRWVKVGLELYLAEGPPLLERLRGDGYEIFLDLKLFDIPNTVAGAIRSVVPLGPRLLTVHASGGPAMLLAAAEAARGSRSQLLAVTVLTSMDRAQLLAVGIDTDPPAQVTRLGLLAADAGIEGLVCSPRETAALRLLLPKALLVTPGIRPAGAAANDQQRTGTPASALRSGASKLVIGRPITAAADPAGAYLSILSEMAAAIQS